MSVDNPRHRLFEALNDLDQEVADVPGLGAREVRKQAVRTIVNTLFPKPKARGAASQPLQPGDERPWCHENVLAPLKGIPPKLQCGSRDCGFTVVVNE